MIRRVPWVGLFVIACGDGSAPSNNPPSETGPNIAEVIQAEARLSTLAALFAEAMIEQRLTVGTLTVFAPTDEAFSKIPELELAALRNDGNALRHLLQYHVVLQAVSADQLSTQSSVTTLIGEPVAIRVAGSSIIATDSQGGDSTLVATDIEAANGVIHLVDSVLSAPPDPANPPRRLVASAARAGLSTFVQAVNDTGLDDTLNGLGPLTVFAPTDAAIEGLADPLPADRGLLANILLNHVVALNLSFDTVAEQERLLSLANTVLVVDSGNDPATIAGAALSRTRDVSASNGVIHVMDEVIVPPTIVEMVRSNPDLSMLASALDVASATVAAVLSGPGPITLFAPSNTAFESIESDALNTLLADRTALDRVLGYHLMSGQNLLDDFREGQVIAMMTGDEVGIDIGVSNVRLIDAAGDGATVRMGDIRLANGTVHIIGDVLSPDPNP